MIRHFAVILLSLWVLVSYGQPTEAQKSIMLPIHNLFDGMLEVDSAKAHSAFVKEVTFTTISEANNGAPLLKPSSLHKFLVAVGTPHHEPWSEMIWDPEIQLDGNFAQVWVKYAFYVGKTFSHCGIDAFHLFRHPDGKWRIFNLADTRHKENCRIPSSISDKFK